jgi:hypothetical protein
MTKKERLEQLEQDLADLRIEVDRLRIQQYDSVTIPNLQPNTYDPFASPFGNSPNYYTCQTCFGKYQIGSFHSCGSGLPTWPYQGGNWFGNWYG